MAGTSLRDRFFTRPVAEAVTSPLGIVLAGAGTAAGILVGLPLVAAAGVGALAYGARVAAAIPRGPQRDRIDPLQLQDPWRSFVWDAKRSQKRFHDATRKSRSGPLKDRLGAIGDRIDTALDEIWRIAQAGAALAEARSAIDVSGVERSLGQVRADGPIEAGSRRERTAASMEAQLATARRLEDTIADTVDRLRLLDARLGEAVTRAIELSARAQGSEDVSALDTDVDDLVGEMEALRQALDATTPDALARAASTDPSAGLASLDGEASHPGSAAGAMPDDRDAAIDAAATSSAPPPAPRPDAAPAAEPPGEPRPSTG